MSALPELKLHKPPMRRKTFTKPSPHHLRFLKALALRPMTDAELALHLGTSPSNTRGRRAELVGMGLVTDSGTTRKTPGRSSPLSHGENKKMNGNEMYVKLIELRDRAGVTHYERIALADRLLKDKDWVDSPTGGGGNEDKAIDRLEAECFADLCGVVGLPEMLDLFHHYPMAQDWRKYKYNLRRMWADWKAQQKPKGRPPDAPRREYRTDLVEPVAFQRLPDVQKNRQYERAVTKHESDLEKIEQLEKENADLKEENARLKEKIKALRNVLKEAA